MKTIIVIKNNIILARFERYSDNITDIKKLYPNCEYKLFEDNSIEYFKGDNITHFSKEGKKYSNKELIQKNYSH